MDLNLLQIVLLFMAFVIVIFGSLVNWFEKYLPVFIPESFRYGKFSYKGKPSNIKVIEVPKRWFKHFYVFSSLYSLYALYLVIDVYIYKNKPSNWLLTYLDISGGSSRKTDCGSSSVITALVLLTLQSFRRFYETFFVSVFSDGKINILLYLVGFTHYWATITAILAEASGFKSPEIPSRPDNLNLFSIIAIIIFTYSWINQHQVAKILANLRKNTKGQVVTLSHKLPQGGLFNYLSSPHFTCEILIYFSLWIILSDNHTFKYVFMWVFINQLETSLLSHWWYKKTFKNYPKQRKAFIPFVF